MSSEYASLTFDTKGYNNEILMAILGEYPFEAFQEDHDTIIGYVLHAQMTEDLLNDIRKMEDKWFNTFQVEHVPDQNWNETWESSFDPIEIHDYCYIRAAFHDLPVRAFQHEIIIAPKMAFGTGHHATTFMMMEAMSGINFSGKKVFDFGCGTGILSVLAAKEGATSVYGIDIQAEAIENSIEHTELNEVTETCSFEKGSLEVVRNQKFDIILANINRHVIQESIDTLKDMLLPGGTILISGIMIEDKEKLFASVIFNPLTVEALREKGDWLQITLH